jgi:hypothetical protein
LSVPTTSLQPCRSACSALQKPATAGPTLVLKVGHAVRLSIGTKGGGARRECGVKLSRLGPVEAQPEPPTANLTKTLTS